MVLKWSTEWTSNWYIGFSQIHGLADWLVSRNDFALAADALRGAFSDEDLTEYKKAWKNSGGLIGMINWYRALARYRPDAPKDIRLSIQHAVQEHLVLWISRDTPGDICASRYRQIRRLVSHPAARGDILGLPRTG